MQFGIHGARPLVPQKTTYRKAIESAGATVYSWRPQPSAERCSAAQTRPTSQTPDPIRIVCISDTHNTQPKVPPGDVLLHAGDLSEFGTFVEVQEQLDWLAAQPHAHKVVIAGNHDLILDANVPKEALSSSRRRQDSLHDAGQNETADSDKRTIEDLNFGSLIYLSPANNTTTLEFASGRKLKVSGSPLTPQYGQWAFQYPPIRDVWTNKLPADADIVMTHGPPLGILDGFSHAGDGNLLKELMRVKPSLAVFGHIHVGAGRISKNWGRLDKAWAEISVLEVGGFVTLLRLLFWVVCARMLAFLRLGRPEKQTVLVNAAVVGGARNEIVREAIVVDI